MENSQAESGQQCMSASSVEFPEGGDVIPGIVRPLLRLGKSLDDTLII
jgi:hypothetical protein